MLAQVSAISPPVVPRPMARPPKPADVPKPATHQFGLKGERSVAHFLRAGGYAVIAHRARFGKAEVDLIVCRDDTVAFVEVKARKRGWDGLHAVTTAKKRRLTAAAYDWLAQNDTGRPINIRFDIALVWANGALEYFEDAFEPHTDDGFVF